MNSNLTIELSRIRFFSYHGLYAEERKTGNEFEISLSVSFKPVKDVIAELAATVNYEQLYSLVKEQMSIPRGLLETVAMEIAESIHSDFPAVRSVIISITKLHVPITGLTGHVGVKYHKDFSV